MDAIPAVRRQIKELVDGTLRVQLDIEPAHKRAFLDLFPEIDAPVAIAPLASWATSQPRATRGEAWSDLGPLCQSAIRLCSDDRFGAFMAEREGDGDTATALKRALGIKTRKDLDRDERAAREFAALMTEFRQWQMDRR